jgi:hypothetical protein
VPRRRPPTSAAPNACDGVLRGVPVSVQQPCRITEGAFSLVRRQPVGHRENHDQGSSFIHKHPLLGDATSTSTTVGIADGMPTVGDGRSQVEAVSASPWEDDETSVVDGG